jgi:LemA protein
MGVIRITADNMNISRTIEVFCCFIVSFLMVVIISCIGAKRILKDAGSEAQAEWDNLLRAVQERNEGIPSLVERFRDVEVGRAKLVAGLLESRSMLMRASDPNVVIAATDRMDVGLMEIESIMKVSPKLETNAPFMVEWSHIVKISRRTATARRNYNNSARLHNRLLTPFPQNMLISLFGYSPLPIYKEARLLGE